MIVMACVRGRQLRRWRRRQQQPRRRRRAALWNAASQRVAAGSSPGSDDAAHASFLSARKIDSNSLGPIHWWFVFLGDFSSCSGSGLVCLLGPLGLNLEIWCLMLFGLFPNPTTTKEAGVSVCAVPCGMELLGDKSARRHNRGGREWAVGSSAPLRFGTRALEGWDDGWSRRGFHRPIGPRRR